jgi:hypothetical protein
MKNFISLALCSLFLAQSANAAEQPTAHKNVRWKRVAPFFVLTTFVSGGSTCFFLNQVIKKQNAAKKILNFSKELSATNKCLSQLEQVKARDAYNVGHRMMRIVIPLSFLTLAASMCSYESIFV